MKRLSNRKLRIYPACCLCPNCRAGIEPVIQEIMPLPEFGHPNLILSGAPPREVWEEPTP